jgi:hypothetical protein
MEISSYLFSADHISYNNSERKKSPIPEALTVLSSEDIQRIETLNTELNTVWSHFHSLQTHTTINNWVSEVAQRSWAMLDNMQQAPIEPHPHVSMETVVGPTSFTKNVEQRRGTPETSGVKNHTL